jgi:hypothetical protein
VTVIVRWIPLVTAAYGTRVARPTSTTMLAPGGDGASAAGGCGPTSVTNCLAGSRQKRRGKATSGTGTVTPRQQPAVA